MEDKQIKMTFFKKLKTSIWKLEDYQILAAEKVGKTILYLFVLVVVFSVILSVPISIQFANKITRVTNFITEEISSLEYKENELTALSKNDSEEPIILESKDVLDGKIIIDTSKQEENLQEKYENQIKDYTNSVVLLKDKAIIQVGGIQTILNYKDVFETSNINQFNKEMLISAISMPQMYVIFYISMVFYLLIIFFSNLLLDGLIYGIVAYVVSIMSGIKLKMGAAYNIAVYALTLPIILNLVYIIINILTGFTIKYFSIMYIAITCIYIIASIFIIKSDVIKKQMELSKIIEEQEKIRQELAEKEQRRKEEEEREKQKKEEEKKHKEERKNGNKEENEDEDSKNNGKRKEGNNSGQVPKLQPENVKNITG